MRGAASQLGLLVEKNFMLQMKRPFLTLIQLIIPLGFMIYVVYQRSVTKIEHVKQQIPPATNMDSNDFRLDAGVIYYAPLTDISTRIMEHFQSILLGPNSTQIGRNIVMDDLLNCIP